MTTRNWLIFAGMVVALLGMILYAVEHGPKARFSGDRPTVTVPEGDAIRVKADVLIQAYRKDRGDANRMFQGKLCDVSGLVTQVDLNWLGAPVVVVHGEEVQAATISFILDVSEAERAKLLKADDVVTVRGVCQGDDARFGVRFKNCVIVPNRG